MTTRSARRRRASRRAGVIVSSVVIMLVMAFVVACSAPDYRFASTTTDGGAVSETGVASDTGAPSPTDATSEPAPPATPLDKIVVGGPSSVDFGADCNAVNGTVSRVFAFVKTDAVSSKKHCYVYFPSDPYKRTWEESKVACLAITTSNPARTSHLATFPSSDEATLVQEAFKSRQIPWIGLELVNKAAPLTKDSWHWINSELNGYDGWVPGTPTGVGLCAAWAENSRWSDVPCDAQKGFLCELDE